MQLTFWPFDLVLEHRWISQAAVRRSSYLQKALRLISSPSRIVRLTRSVLQYGVISTSKAVTARGFERFPVMFVRLEAEDGTVGLGEATPSSRYAENLASATAFFNRIDPQRLSFQTLDESLEYLHGISDGDCAAKAALDVALFDGIGRKLRKPVYDVLGCGFTEKKHTRAITIGVDDVAVIRQKVLEADQYPALIIKVGTPWDRRIMTAVRETCPDKALRLDANESWKTKEEAIRNIEWLAKGGHADCMEQPMPASTRPEDLRWLRERSPLPLIADESFVSIRDLNLCADCYHGVNVKLAKLGGIKKSYQALQAARASGLKTMIGCMLESSLLGTAAAHLCELADYIHFDGNLLITNDPYFGVTTVDGFCSFASASEQFGLRVSSGRIAPCS